MIDGRGEFHRPARVYAAPVACDEIIVPPPPHPPEGMVGGLLQAMAPALGSVGMLGFAVISGNGRFIVLAGVMGGVMVLGGIVTRQVQKRNAERQHRQRSDRYRRMLAEHRTALLESRGRQRRWNRSSYPSPMELWSVVVDRRRIWERRLGHEDFMTVRLGIGSIAPALRARLGDIDPMTQPDDELLDLAGRLVSDFDVMDREPVTFDLGESGCVAIVGGSDEAREAARAILTQLVVFRAPDDLKLVVSHDPLESIDWAWTARLPHTSTEGRPLVTADREDLATILDQLARPRLEHLDRSRGLLGADAPLVFPRVVVVLDGYDPEGGVGRMEQIDTLLAKARTIGFTFICIVAESTAVPSVADTTIVVSDRVVRAWKAQPNAPRLQAATDSAPIALCTQLASVLHPLRLRLRTGRATTVDSAGLAELLGILEPESMTPDDMWCRRPTGNEMVTPIGVTEDGSPVMLDLKESSVGGMGPHGMLIGATGSGKSELLRTLVLGLAARHEPEEVAFVLVDFKGGATFAKLDRLPHSAGLITNLERDPSLTERMLEALYGELERRQRLLHEAGGFDRADEYRAHRSSHPDDALDPLPALLIVVDEFGELLTAKPEFSDLFAAIGRVGRSLGVHLLLSTQRLEDGRIRKLEGHLRYRLCLRTFTPEESMAVIGSKAAAELPPIPGAGYLKVDGGLQPFKAGLVNRPMRGTDRTEMEQMMAVLGGPETAHRRTRAVWLDPLPATCDLTNLTTGRHEPGDPDWLRFPVGWEDDPRRQRVRPMVLDFTGARGNLAVVGAPRTGKSTMLQTLVASASLTHRPADLQIYAIDFGGGGLHLFEELPHVGAVLTRGHRAEIAKLVRRLHSLCEERAGVFRRHRITDMMAYHRLRSSGEVDDELGEVLLIVDNWGGFCQEQPLDVVDSVSELVGSGLHHGIHVVLATPRWHDVKLAVRDHIGGRFELRLADPVDSEIDRRAAKGTPSDVPGRGLSMDGLQVHIALPRTDGIPEPGSIAVGSSALVESIRARWRGHVEAAPVRVLPDLVRAGDLPASDGVVLGLEEHRLSAWSIDLFGPDPHMLVFGDAESGKTNALQRLIEQLCLHHAPSRVQVAVVDYRRRILGSVPESHRLGVAAGADSAAVIASRINADLAVRVMPDEVSRLRHAGPAFVLVVDDYDLVAGAAGNPLSPLVDRVAQGRDLGLHLVLARRVGGTARASFEPLFQRVRELGSPGLILAGDPQEGPLVGGVKAAMRTPGRGVWVSRNTTTEVQVGLCEPVSDRHPGIEPQERPA